VVVILVYRTREVARSYPGDGVCFVVFDISKDFTNILNYNKT